jgi:REP element-mobilizing transposase RayT
MPRVGRVVLPHYPHHVVQRGHNRQVVFAEDGDFQRYLEDLRELKETFGVKVYAFCARASCPAPFGPAEAVQIRSGRICA